MRYSISTLARKTGLSIHTLRFYEKEGLLRYVERTPSGRRIYNEASMGCLMGVQCMKQAGMTLPQIKEFLDATKEGASTLPHRLEMVLHAKEQLQKMMESIQQGLELADFFIAGCQKALEAAKQGKNPDKAFPYITLDGIVNFPFIITESGKFEPAPPPEAQTKASAKRTDA